MPAPCCGNPQHPYSIQLKNAVLSPDAAGSDDARRRRRADAIAAVTAPRRSY